jgi:hypothetical protein
MPNYIGVVGNEHADRLAAMDTTHPTIIDVEMKHAVAILPLDGILATPPKS